MLRERVDRDQRFERLRQIPVLLEFGRVKVCPLSDQA
jgi:hypothetical protein